MDFSDVETEFQQLKAKFEAGELSEEDFKARLQDLMIQDAQGRWWMIGYETSSWYCYQDEQWIPSEPPAVEVAPTKAAIPAQPPGKLAWQSLLLVVAGWSLNFWIVSEVDFWSFLYPHPGLGLSWFLAGLATGAALRWAEPAIRWSDALWIACVWGLGGLLISLAPFTPEEDVYTSITGVFLVLLGGGLVCELAIWRAGRVVRWYHVLVVALAWALAIIAAVLIFDQINHSDQFYPGPPLISALLGALVGVIGGGASLWQLSQAGYAPRYQPAPARQWPVRLPLPGALAGRRGGGILAASALLLILTAAGIRQFQLSGLGASKGEVLAKLSGHTNWVSSAAFSPDGPLALTTSEDGTARLWQADTGDLVYELRVQSAKINYAAFIPSYQWVVTTHEDGTARLWSVNSGKTLFEYPGYGAALNHAAFLPNGRWLATVSDLSDVQIWDLYSGSEVRIVTGDGEPLDRVAFSPNGKWLVASSNHRSFVWDASSGNLIATLINPIPKVGPAFTPDSSKVLTATGWDGEWRFWKLPEGIPVSWGAVEAYPLVAALSPDGKYLAVSEGNYDHVELWSLEPFAQRVAFLRGHKGPVRSLAFSYDGKWLVTASDDGTARVWEVATRRLVSMLDTHIDYLNVAAFSLDGQRVITQGTANTAWIWRVGSP